MRKEREKEGRLCGRFFPTSGGNGNVQLTRSIRYSRGLPSLQNISLNNMKGKDLSFSFLKRVKIDCRFPYLLRSYRCSEHCTTISSNSIYSVSQIRPCFNNCSECPPVSLWPWEIVDENGASSPLGLLQSSTGCSVLLKIILPLLRKSKKE